MLTDPHRRSRRDALPVIFLVSAYYDLGLYNLFESEPGPQQKWHCPSSLQFSMGLRTLVTDSNRNYSN